MPTYPTQIAADGYTARYSTPRNTGPYKHDGALYVVNFNPQADPIEWWLSAIEVWKSEDEGDTWTLQDSGNSPAPYTDLYNNYTVSTFQDGENIVVIYTENGGPTIGGTENGRLCFRPFSMSSDTWGTLVTDGPTIYDTGVFPDGEPEGGWTGYSGGAFVGFTGVGVASGVKRSTGEYVFVYDSHDEIHYRDDLGPGVGYYYRRCSLVRYSSGAWSTPVPLFAPLIGITLREYFQPMAVLGEDDAVHIFAGSVGYAGEDDLAYTDVTSMHAHYVALSPSNDFGTQYTVSEDLDATFAWDSLGQAIRVGDTLYVAYRKSNDTLAVSRADVAWVALAEDEVAALDNAMLMPLAVALVAAGSSAHLFWIDATDGDADQLLNHSVWSGSVWPAPTVEFTLGSSNSHGTELFTGAAMTGAIGMTLLYGATSFAWPLVYLQIPLAATGGPRNRYYGR